MTKSKKKTASEKFTLVELVEKSELHYPLIVMNLSRAGLLKQYKTYGTCVDGRGHTTKQENPNKGRPIKTTERALEEYSKEHNNWC